MGFNEFWCVGYRADGLFALVLGQGRDVGEDRLEIYHGHKASGGGAWTWTVDGGRWTMDQGGR
eukprot:scaffold46878_cov72-Cyclotella_meneghiniana.AAC.4